MPPSEEQIREALREVQDPGAGTDLVAARAVRAAAADGDAVRVEVRLGYPAKGLRERLAAEVEACVLRLDGVRRAEVDAGWEIQAHSVQKNLKPM